MVSKKSKGKKRKKTSLKKKESKSSCHCPAPPPCPGVARKRFRGRFGSMRGVRGLARKALRSMTKNSTFKKLTLTKRQRKRHRKRIQAQGRFDDGKMDEKHTPTVMPGKSVVSLSSRRKPTAKTRANTMDGVPRSIRIGRS